MLRHHAFAMNLVERFSPVVRDYRAWARRTGRLTVMRVESFWGKHRIADPRPTIGVLSELIHPVDLIRYLFPDNDLRILGGHGVESDFSPHSASILDSLDLHATMGDAPVLLHSSYAWPTRQRTISALLWSPTEGMIRVELDLDTPHWDCDRLDISRIASNGRWARIHHSATDVATLPLPIQGVGKVVNFLDSSLRAARTGRADDELVDLTTAGELQKICNDIDRSIRRFDAPACYRRDAEHVEVEV
jgi:predicted dehydrogenase